MHVSMIDEGRINKKSKCWAGEYRVCPVSHVVDVSRYAIYSLNDSSTQSVF